MVTRREFLDALAVGAAGLAVGNTAESYARIVGANDRLNFAVIGLNGRGYAHLSSLKANRSAARISHDCNSRPLACTNGHRGVAGGQARLRRKALQPQSCRGSDAGGGAAEIWKAGANGKPAALFGTQHRDRGKNSRWSDRQAVPGESVVQQCEEVHWHRQGSARAGATGLGFVTVPDATASVSAQRSSLQLALVQKLWHRRNAQ